MTDKEMLLIAYGALRSVGLDATSAIIRLIEDHLFEAGDRTKLEGGG